VGKRSCTLENMVINPAFWKGRQVFITGHTGFKGSWLSLWLQRLGAEVTGYALLPNTKRNLFDLAKVTEGMRSVIGDVRNLENLQAALLNSKPEVVFHMAAQPLVRLSYEDPVTTYSTNVMGTVNLLEAIRGCDSVKAVVNVTTDKVYESREWVWGFRENDQLGGSDPYSNSKACSEFVTNSYRSSYFNPNLHKQHGVGIATARAGNVIGGGDWSKERLIPDVIDALQTGSILMLRYPNAVRPWQHVLDPLSGYLLLAEKLCTSGPEFSQSWNFGPTEEGSQSVEWVVNHLASLWGEKISYKIIAEPSLPETTLLKLDISKARSQLNWVSKLNIRNALEFTVRWEKNRLNGVAPKDLIDEQINEYSS
jgi:CDP-glucose 4,6-dehydratase